MTEVLITGGTPGVTGELWLGDVCPVFASPARARDELGFTAAQPVDDCVAEFARDLDAVGAPQ